MCTSVFSKCEKDSECSEVKICHSVTDSVLHHAPIHVVSFGLIVVARRMI